MKIAIIGDAHFGASYSLGELNRELRVNSRLIDYGHTFDYIIEYIRSNKIEHVIFTGDVFEHRQPSPSEYKYFFSVISQLLDIVKRIDIIDGNHDIVRSEKGSTTDPLKELGLPNLFIHNDFDWFHAPYVSICFGPYRNRQMLDAKTDQEAIDTINKLILSKARLRTGDGLPNLFVGHFMTHGTILNDVEMIHYSYNELKLPIEFFEQFDMSVLGHIHKQQIFRKRPHIVYVGSPEYIDFGEADHNKSFMIYETTTNTYDTIKLPSKKVFEYSFNFTLSEPKDINKLIISELTKKINKNPIDDGIVKCNIVVRQRIKDEIDKKEIKRFLYSSGASFVVDVNITGINSERSRISTISEKINPKQSFEEYLKINIKEDHVRKQLREAGLEIMGQVK